MISLARAWQRLGALARAYGQAHPRRMSTSRISFGPCPSHRGARIELRADRAIVQTITGTAERTHLMASTPRSRMRAPRSRATIHGRPSRSAPSGEERESIQGTDQNVGIGTSNVQRYGLVSALPRKCRFAHLRRIKPPSIGASPLRARGPGEVRAPPDADGCKSLAAMSRRCSRSLSVDRPESVGLSANAKDRDVAAREPCAQPLDTAISESPWALSDERPQF